MNIESTAFNYFKNNKSVLDERVDYILNEVEKCNLQALKKFTHLQYCEMFSQNINNLSSLIYFHMVKENTFGSEVLKSKYSFKPLQPKF